MGTQWVEIIGVNDKRQITAMFCGTLSGDFLPIQLIYQGNSPRCHPHYDFPAGWNITHSFKHWSTEDTMLEYIEHIIVPYVETTRDWLNDNKAALVIMDNFKGQVTASVNSLLDRHNIHVCLLPPNTTDLLQPMDISVNKPAKDFLKREFEQWYAEQVMRQLKGQDIDSAGLQEINLGLPVLKEVAAKWLVNTAEYITENPQFIVNDFIRSGIAGALDACYDEECDEQSTEDDSDNNSDTNEEDLLEDNIIVIK